jgi:arsenate reductase (thioredoxin)
MKKALILCTGNSCRSIMAEGLINHYLGAKWEAFSAGVSPSVVNPYAIKVLQELGIDTTGLYSKSVTEFLSRDDLDLVITVCDNARENCPVFLKSIKQMHITIEDPILYAEKNAEKALMKFREVRDTIIRKIVGYLQKYYN